MNCSGRLLYLNYTFFGLRYIARYVEKVRKMEMETEGDIEMVREMFRGEDGDSRGIWR
jgi:hypothetical protein